MAQDEHYEIDGRKDAKEYYWTGAKGERRAYGKAYADARSKDDSDYMKNVAKGGENYIQARMKDDADWEDVKQQNPKLRSSSKRGTSFKGQLQGNAKRPTSSKKRSKALRKP